MKHCPHCNKRIWSWQEKQYTNKKGGNKVYHASCYIKIIRKFRGLEEV